MVPREARAEVGANRHAVDGAAKWRCNYFGHDWGLLMDLVYYNGIGGDSLSAINCPLCDHRTPFNATCPTCQPNPTVTRCDTCRIRGPIPTVTTTIAPGQVNDPPGGPTTETIVTSASGKNQPPGHNA